MFPRPAGKPVVVSTMILLALAGSACRGPMRRPAPGAELPPSVSPEIETPLPEVAAPAEILPETVVWTPPTVDELLAGAEFIESRPDVRLSAVIPESLFGDDDKAWRAWQIVKKLVGERRLDLVLQLPGDPPLALLQDTDAARVSSATVAALPPRYSWPDDVAGHLAAARGAFRRRWHADPKAVVMPGGLLAGPEIAPLQKMKFSWVLLTEGGGVPGVFGGLPVSVVRPAPFPLPSGRAAWLASRRSVPLEAAGEWRPVRLSTQEELAAFAAEIATGAWTTVTDAVASDSPLPVWPGLDGAAPDFSPWIGEPEENAAWRLLGQTRRAVEDYQNSGQADVRSLDLALREIYNAQSGRYFYYFGSDFNSGQDGDLEREFLASLAQVYRLMGQNVPAGLLQNVAAAGGAPEETPEAAERFFLREGTWLRWADASKDDRGSGDLFYPAADGLNPGSWDLLRFDVRPAEKSVNLVFEMAALSNPWNGPAGFSGAMIDVYIDINRLIGAGADRLLPGRTGLVDSQNSWEYALSVTGWGARLYQYSPGSPAKLLARLPVRASGRTIRVDLPREKVRGEPDRWGFGVAVFGHDPAPAGAEPGDKPLRVLPQPGPRQFGGAWQGTANAAGTREAPPFIDALCPPSHPQTEVLGVYKQGRDVVLPVVRAEEQ